MQHASFFNFSSQFKNRKREKETERGRIGRQIAVTSSFSRKMANRAGRFNIQARKAFFFLFFFSVRVFPLRTRETLMLRVQSVRQRICTDFGVRRAVNFASGSLETLNIVRLVLACRGRKLLCAMLARIPV